MIKKKEKVLVAMSGGVDSSVAAALLVRQGYEVTGMFAVNYSENNCWQSDYQDALRVAAKLGIPLLRLDFQKEYKKTVLDYMYKEYAVGRTPNPDVMCNKFIKFGVWLEAAKKLGFDYLATGHYASLREEFPNIKYQITNKLKIQNSKKLLFTSYQLRVAKDKNKDQTYFLHQLTQTQLKHVLFPLGGYLKSEVRSLARRFSLPTAEKEESMGVCFVGEVNMKDFLQKKIKVKKGDVILSDGTKVGGHEGLAFYTIGQRRVGKITNYKLQITNKLQSPNNKPFYVVNKNVKKNQLIVGFENDHLLYKKQVIATDINWISGQESAFPLKCEVRLRHRQPLQKCLIKTLKHKNFKTLMIEFDKPQRAATSGQFAVFYLNGECLGGGVIK